MINKVSSELNDIKKVLAERIRGFMIEKNLNAIEMAKKCNIPRSTFCNYLACTRTVQIDSLCKIATYMGVSTDYLLGRED